MEGASQGGGGGVPIPVGTQGSTGHGTQCSGLCDKVGMGQKLEREEKKCFKGVALTTHTVCVLVCVCV